jgi:hypothetical protein
VLQLGRQAITGHYSCGHNQVTTSKGIPTSLVIFLSAKQLRFNRYALVFISEGMIPSLMKTG